MSYIEQAIREAVEGGYQNFKFLMLKPPFDSVVADEKGVEARQERDGWKQGSYVSWREIKEDAPRIFLDPLFWQALGKAREWERQYAYAAEWYPRAIMQEEWHYHWHRFIDHLAEAKTAEEFFKSLTPKEE